MLQKYDGEFLINPVPIEMSMGPCSHACAYCFSRRAGYRGWAGVKGFLRTLDNALSGRCNNGLAKLLRDKYPVCLSNRSDPFAASNSADTAQVLAVLRAQGIPVFFQTKGGPGAWDAAEQQSRSVWYMSMSFWDDAKREVFEPGAPSVQSRLDLIKHLRACGHEVLVGLNPLVPDWLGEDYKQLCDALAALGVHGVLLQRLHLAADSKAVASPRERDVLQPYYQDARKRTHTLAVRDYAREVLTYCDLIGLSHYPPDLDTIYTAFFDVFRDVYPKTFPINQDFLNWCALNKQPGDNVTFAEYYNTMRSRLPEGLWELDRNIHSVARNLAVTERIPRFMTYEQLLKIIWAEPKHSGCPANFPVLSYADVGPVDKWAGQEVLIWRQPT